MARPRKSPEEQRRNVVNIRFTDAEFAQLEKQAQEADLPTRRYIRETCLGRRPRAKSANTILFRKLLYELQSIATNFQQLAEALDDAEYIEWARYTGGTLVELLLGREDLAGRIEQQMEKINAAGQIVNGHARRANTSGRVTKTDKQEMFAAVRTAVEPLDMAAKQKQGQASSSKQPVS